MTSPLLIQDPARFGRVAVLLGGTDIRFERIGQTPYSLGLDWFVLSLLFSALVVGIVQSTPFRMRSCE